MAATHAALALALLGAAVGPLTCLEGDPDAAPAERTAAEIWRADCARCHGIAGDGSGEAGHGLDPPVPDFTHPCRRPSDAWIERAILDGAAAFHGNPAMRPHHALADDPDVLHTLVTHVQALRSSEACREGDAPVAAPDVVD